MYARKYYHHVFNKKGNAGDGSSFFNKLILVNKIFVYVLGILVTWPWGTIGERALSRRQKE